MNTKILQQLNHSWDGFLSYRDRTFHQRADLLRQIALEIDRLGDQLITVAMQETNLTEQRLKGEKARTIFQLNSYAEACEKCSWMEVSIDTADLQRTPPKMDIRKTAEPLGPVLVFGASNFPFAYSTAGGDTASALAAGCSVIVKAHPAHPQTSNLMARAIWNAITNCNLNHNIFQHIHCDDFAEIEAMVQYPSVKAVGFTGSFEGGTAIAAYAAGRRDPIPVFAEMVSTNPVFVFQHYLSSGSDALAKQLAASITLGMGQFCTKPGLIFIKKSDLTAAFLECLRVELEAVVPANLLHQGILDRFNTKSEGSFGQANVEIIANGQHALHDLQVNPVLVTCDAYTFIGNPVLHQEVFGPMALVVQYENDRHLLHLIDSLAGQLTCSVFGDRTDLLEHMVEVDKLKMICGRLIFNNVPTGVEVCLSMQHGGPYPATTDGRFGSVGADAIKRFSRPLCYQNCPDEFLPEEIKNANPLGIWRTVNNELSQAPIGL